MTLIQCATLGGILHVMTSDTRHVHFIEVGGKKHEYRFHDPNSKIKRISPFCLWGAGGLENLSDIIFEDLEKSNAVYIKDFIEPLERSVDRLRADKSQRFSLDSSEYPTMLKILGYGEDGTTGEVGFYSGGEVYYEEFKFGNRYSSAIAPSKDEWDIIRKTVKFNNPGVVEGYMEACIEELAGIQQALHLNDSDSVSEIFCYTALFRDPDSGEFRCFEDKIELKKNDVEENER